MSNFVSQYIFYLSSLICCLGNGASFFSLSWAKLMLYFLLQLKTTLDLELKLPWNCYQWREIPKLFKLELSIWCNFLSDCCSQGISILIAYYSRVVFLTQYSYNNSFLLDKTISKIQNQQMKIELLVSCWLQLELSPGQKIKLRFSNFYQKIQFSRNLNKWEIICMRWTCKS